MLASLLEVVSTLPTPLNPNLHPWLPCFENKGFTPLSFISLLTGMNIALSKWGAFRNSLLEVEKQFDEVKEETLKQKGRPALFASDEGAAELKLLPTMLESELQKIREKNAKRWRNARRCATAMAWIGVVALFLNLSLGVFGAILAIPWGMTHISARKSLKNIRREVEGKIDALASRLAALGQQQQPSLEQGIDSALT